MKEKKKTRNQKAVEEGSVGNDSCAFERVTEAKKHGLEEFFLLIICKYTSSGLVLWVELSAKFSDLVTLGLNFLQIWRNCGSNFGYFVGLEGK